MHCGRGEAFTAADRPPSRRTIVLILVWALVVATIDIAHILNVRDPGREPRVSAPRANTATPAPVAPATTAPPPVAPPPSESSTPRRRTNAAAGGAANVPSPPPAKPSAEPAAPAPPPPINAGCNSDLQLADAPDAPYNFLCSANGVPITWPSNTVTLFTSGLDPVQATALEVALPQWQATGMFTVTRVNNSAAAQIVMTTGTLTSDEGGRANVHYTCSTSCAFDHADVELSSSVSLDTTLWVATILHELGHVAGLNHVARRSEVMYPTIDITTTPAYGSGDSAGLRELAKLRSASTS